MVLWYNVTALFISIFSSLKIEYGSALLNDLEDSLQIYLPGIIFYDEN